MTLPSAQEEGRQQQQSGHERSRKNIRKEAGPPPNSTLGLEALGLGISWEQGQAEPVWRASQDRPAPWRILLSRCGFPLAARRKKVRVLPHGERGNRKPMLSPLSWAMLPTPGRPAKPLSASSWRARDMDFKAGHPSCEGVMPRVSFSFPFIRDRSELPDFSCQTTRLSKFLFWASDGGGGGGWGVAQSSLAVDWR